MPEATVSIANLSKALVAAQREVKGVTRGNQNKHFRYYYASSEDMIAEARRALSSSGLALLTLGWSVRETLQPKTGEVLGAGDMVAVRYLLVHESGETLELAGEGSIIEEKGKPLDKAQAIALTFNLAYVLRGLLLMDRPHADDEVDERDDSEREPGQRNSKPEEPSHVAALASVGVTKDQLATFLGHDPATVNAKEWALLKDGHGALKEKTTTWDIWSNAPSIVERRAAAQQTQQGPATTAAPTHTSTPPPTTAAPSRPPTTTAAQMREPGEDDAFPEPTQAPEPKVTAAPGASLSARLAVATTSDEVKALRKEIQTMPDGQEKLDTQQLYNRRLRETTAAAKGGGK